MHTKAKLALGAAALAVVAAGTLVYFYKTQPANTNKYGGLALNEVKTLLAPKGTIDVTVNPARVAASPAAPQPTPAHAIQGSQGDWPSYNRTLDSNRFSPLTQINTTNASQLEVKCTYDTGDLNAFETGPIVLDGAMIVTTQKDIISLDPQTCKVNWRTHENVPNAALLTNRGAAFSDGVLVRGMQTGDVNGYDFATGRKLWTTNIADMKAGESVPAAPLAWDGHIFVGTAGGDVKGVKGRLYSLDAKTGRIEWELYLVPYAQGDKVRGPLVKAPIPASSWQTGPDVPISGGGNWTHYTLDPATGTLYVPGGNPAPDFAIALREGDNLFSGSVIAVDAKTGAYRTHYDVTNHDWHDWDVSNTPIIPTSKAGKNLLVVTPKDGQVYAFDRGSQSLLWKTAATTRKNADVQFEVGKKVDFCPGTVGGAEWNSPVYEPADNLIMTGQVDWCYAVKLDNEEEILETKNGQPWTGMATINPLHTFGKSTQSARQWGGWVDAYDADTGQWAWKAHLNYPVVSGLTPTAGGVTFFGDMGGNFYAVDSANGTPLFHFDNDIAIAGGVIAYQTPAGERIAMASGMTSSLWPTRPGSSKLVVFGLKDSARPAA